MRCDVLCRLNEKELEINEIQLPLPFGTYAQQQPMAAVELIQRVALACALSQSPSRALIVYTCVCVRFVLCCVRFVFLFVFVSSCICVCTDFYHSLLIAADMTRRRARCFVFVCNALGRGERTDHWSTLTHTQTHWHVHSLSARIVGCVLIRQVCVIILLFSEQLPFVSCCCCCCSKGLC